MPACELAIDLECEATIQHIAKYDFKRPSNENH